MIKTLVEKRRKSSTRTGVIVLPVALLMLVLSTAVSIFLLVHSISSLMITTHFPCQHLVVDLVKALKTFSILRFHGHDAASTYYQALSDPLFLAKNSIYLLQTSLGDGVLVCNSLVLAFRLLQFLMETH